MKVELPVAFPERIFRNRIEQGEPVECCICGKDISTESASTLEFCRTKRGSDLFFHHDCYKRWGK